MQQENQFIEQRKRRFLLMIPVITIPFILLLFYSLGGGKAPSSTDDGRTSALSTTLPTPLLDEKRPMDKLSLYEQAAKDSIKQRQSDAHDPFAAWMPTDTTRTLPPASKSPYSYSPNASYDAPVSPLFATPKKSPEAELEQKIAQLEKALKTSQASASEDTLPAPLPRESISSELQQLESMMQSLGAPASAPDPELAQAASLMEKILDVQHPDRVRERLRSQSLDNKKAVYPVSASPVQPTGDLLIASASIRPTASLYNRFFDEDPEPVVHSNAILASVRETQVLVGTATINLRLEQDAYVQGQLIPKGSSVFGTSTLNGERLEITVHSIQKGNSIFPVSLTAYGMDGIPGIRIKGSISRDASKESSERAMQTLTMSSLDPSVGAQAATAGIQAAKNLLSKKIKLVEVTAKVGHPLLLVPDKNNL